MLCVRRKKSWNDRERGKNRQIERYAYRQKEKYVYIVRKKVKIKRDMWTKNYGNRS